MWYTKHGDVVHCPAREHCFLMKHQQ